MIWSPIAPEVTGYFWHRDTDNVPSPMPPRPLGRKARIVKLKKDQGTAALIVFDPDSPMETISAWCYGGEFAGPIEEPK